MPTSFIAQDIMAEHLLSHNAIVFLKDKPMRLRSGLVTPIYVDNPVSYTHLTLPTNSLV